MEKICVYKCTEYDLSLIKDRLKMAIENFGGIEKYIKNGTKVLIKPNLLMPKKPENATTTHPTFLEALILIIKEAGGVVTVADSPGGLYNSAILSRLYNVCGITEVCKRTGAILNFDTGCREINFKGKFNYNFNIINPFFENDIIISCAKLKTHSMTSYTGAVKNLYGSISGLLKAQLHYKFSQKNAFCEMVVDLCDYLKPTLSFIDGIVGMEGNGPSNGIAREFGVIIASESPHLADFMGSTIMGFNANTIETLNIAMERGLIPKNITDCEILGDDYTKLIANNVKKPDSLSITFDQKIPKFLLKWLKNRIYPLPFYDYNKCIGCGECALACPPKAITIKNKKPVLLKEKCIKCYCCQELCPKNAVILKKKWFRRK